MSWLSMGYALYFMATMLVMVWRPSLVLRALYLFLAVNALLLGAILLGWLLAGQML